MSKSLLQLTHGYLELLDRAYELEQAGEDVPAEVQDSIGEMLTAQAEKVDNCASLVLHCKHQQEWLKEEKKRIDFEIKKMEYIQDKMKYLAKCAMDLEGVQKITGNKGHYFSKRKSKAVEITDINKLQEEYLKTTIVTAPDKIKIKDDLKAGRSVEGAELKINESVTIK